MAEIRNDNYDIRAPKPIDRRSMKTVSGESVPFASVAEAHAATTYKSSGVPIYVTIDGVPVEHQYIGSKIETNLLPLVDIGVGNRRRGRAIESTSPVIKGASSLRAVATPENGDVYKLVINNTIGDFIFDSSDVNTSDDGVVNIRRNGGGVFKRILGDKLNVKWWGATGNGSTDDYPAIQAAVNFCIAHPEITRTVWFPRGTYSISAPIIAYSWNGAIYNFFSIELIGETIANMGAPLFLTTIQPTFNNTFAIGIQLGKSCRVRGLYIKGVAADQLTFANQKDFVEKPFSSFMNGLCRDTQFSPYQGVAIDPFRQLASIPTDGGFPGYTSFYRGDGSKGGSSGIVVDECRIFGFTVGVGISLNGDTLNAEVITVSNCYFGHTKVAVASGQDQTKNNFIRGITCWEYIHTVIDNNTYGTGIGVVPLIDGLNIAQAVNRIVNLVDAGRSGCHLTNIFAESLWRIGTIQSDISSSISEFDIGFIVSEGASIPPPDTYLSGKNVTFSNGSLRIFDNTDKRLHFLDCLNINFNNVTFQNLPITKIWTPSGYLGGAHYDHCNFSIAGGVAGLGYISTQIGTGDEYIQLGEPLVVSNPINWGEYRIKYEAQDGETLFPTEEAYTVTVNKSTSTATLTVSHLTAVTFQVGDYLRTETQLIGRITSIDGNDVITLGGVPISIVTGAYYIYVTYVKKVGTPFVGDVTSGSKTITNVEAFAGYPKVGDRIENSYFGYYRSNSSTDTKVGTWITAVNPGAKTVTVNDTAQATATYVDFALGNPKFSVTNRLTPAQLGADNFVGVFFRNTVWTVKGQNTNTLDDTVYKFLRSGYLNAAGISGAIHQASVITLYDYTGGGAGSQWTTIDANNISYTGGSTHTLVKVFSPASGTVAGLDLRSFDGVDLRVQSNPTEAFIGTISNHDFTLSANSTSRIKMPAAGGVVLTEQAGFGDGILGVNNAGKVYWKAAGVPNNVALLDQNNNFGNNEVRALTHRSGYSYFREESNITHIGNDAGNWSLAFENYVQMAVVGATLYSTVWDISVPVKIASLAALGTRMVVADSTGVLSYAAIPPTPEFDPNEFEGDGTEEIPYTLVAKQFSNKFSGDGVENPVDIVVANLGTGGTSTDFLRKDGTWAAAGGGTGDVTEAGNNDFTGTNTFTNLTVNTGSIIVDSNGSYAIATVGSAPVLFSGSAEINGDVILKTTGKGIIVKSPDGTYYRLTPANGGGSSVWTAV